MLARLDLSRFQEQISVSVWVENTFSKENVSAVGKIKDGIQIRTNVYASVDFYFSTMLVLTALRILRATELTVSV